MLWENDRDYHFRRITDAGEEWATFKKFNDGSAVVVTKDAAEIFELRPDAWQRALDDLRSRRFVMIEAAP